MTDKILTKEEKINALKQEFRQMNTNNDRGISHNELIFNLDKKNVI